MASITVDAITENVTTVTEFVDTFLEEHDCNMKAQIQIDVAIDEIFSNIVNYAYEGVGKATIDFGIDEDTRTVSITFSDSGIPYNPLKKDDPDITLSIKDREIGGLGIFMVKKTMDSMDYEYSNGQNVLRITKQI